MCIIVYKPSGIKVPSEQILKECFNSNPDGAGFMYLNGDKVRVQKGFMDYKKFLKALNKVAKLDEPLVMHFRITTHGGTSKAMTQPFVVSQKTDKLKSVDASADVGIAHNGIIPMTSDAKEISDTALFVKRYLSNLLKPNYSKFLLDVIEECIGSSRMAIMQANGDVDLIGKGWKEDDGVWYSNTSYKPYQARYESVKRTGFDYYSYYGTPFYDDELSKDECEMWSEWRENCDERIATDEVACYSCQYNCYCWGF